ncbi:hypothetical protein ACFE04_002815 [Oxalis oulophora]
MDLDLNQQPALLDTTTTHASSSVVQLESLLNQLESTHGQIEERIRQLEAVSLRATIRQTSRQHITPHFLNVSPAAPTATTTTTTTVTTSTSAVDDARSKTNSTELIAKALGMLPQVQDTTTTATPAGSGGPSFYDCNICFTTPKQPILTCCGHLFCWSCFYQLSYTHSNVKYCPVCKGEVKDTSIVPIYGHGSQDDDDNNNSNSSNHHSNIIKLPPRPHAHRVEGVRQQLVNRRIQVVSNVIGLMGQGSPSVMDSAERLVEDLEAYIHSRRLRRSNQHPDPSTVDQPQISTDTSIVGSSSSTRRRVSDADIGTTSHRQPRRRRLR